MTIADHKITIQKHGDRYRADLLINSTICETGYGGNPEAAVHDLGQRCKGSPWREIANECEVTSI